MKKLIALIPTQGKSKEQLAREVGKVLRDKKVLNSKKINSKKSTEVNQKL